MAIDEKSAFGKLALSVVFEVDRLLEEEAGQPDSYFDRAVWLEQAMDISDDVIAKALDPIPAEEIIEIVASDTELRERKYNPERHGFDQPDTFDVAYWALADTLLEYVLDDLQVTDTSIGSQEVAE